MIRYFLFVRGFLFIVLAVVALPMVARSLSLQEVPEPARCYFAAVEVSDLQRLTLCFQTDAMIIDVNRKISGIDDIQTWAENEVLGGRYEILSIVSQAPARLKLLIRFVPPGFGDSSRGFKAHYTFDFNVGKIIRMDLQYA